MDLKANTAITKDFMGWRVACSLGLHKALSGHFPTTANLATKLWGQIAEEDANLGMSIDELTSFFPSSNRGRGLHSSVRDMQRSGVNKLEVSSDSVNALYESGVPASIIPSMLALSKRSNITAAIKSSVYTVPYSYVAGRQCGKSGMMADTHLQWYKKETCKNFLVGLL